MSLHLDFEPHSWYMGFAIKRNKNSQYITDYPWQAYTDDGNTYQIVKRHAGQLHELKAQIRAYHLRKHTGYGERIAKRRLEYLRGEIQAGCISYGEIGELQALVGYIEPGDVELLEWAGVEE